MKNRIFILIPAKRKYMKRLLFALILTSTAFGQFAFKKNHITVDEMKVAVDGPSREIAYTNKEAGYFYTETNGMHRTGWQGWHIMSVKMLDDYRITMRGDTLKKETSGAEAFPHQLVRQYPNGVTETITMLDSVDALTIELRNLRATVVHFAPLFGGSPRFGDYIVKWERKVLLIALKRHLHRTASENYPVWIGITSAPLITSVRADADTVAAGLPFSPAELVSHPWHDRTTFVLVAGDSAEQTVDLARRVAENYPSMISSRARRMERLLNSSFFRCNDRRFTLAVNWAKISVDALIMNQLKKGIFAGLPWFDNYWGRDSYISLPGATLVTGDFAEAKQILRSFAGWQDKDVNSPTYGRVPNIVTTTSIGYNTADGTPWFTIAAEEFIRTSGDTAYAREIYPAVNLAISAAIARRLDPHGFLTHADADSWMDAVGPNGPWSPRGDRANDIQMLWYRQLQAGADLAVIAGDRQNAEEWRRRADSLRMNFNKYFVNADSGLVYDHLNRDGSPDRQMRPNQIFTLGLVNDSLVRARIFRNITERLVYPYGVASLWQEDPNFHPWHHYEPNYVQDAAYHNGVVWTWLAGPWIEAATGYGLSDLAYRVTQSMTAQILDRGAVGTISELLDAAPRPGESEPRLSGTFSQAWSLAEYLRTVYQGYLGIRVDAVDRKLFLSPHLPDQISEVECTIPVGSASVHAIIRLHGGNGEIQLMHSSKEVLGVEIDLQKGRKDLVFIPTGQKLVIPIVNGLVDGVGPVEKGKDPDMILLNRIHLASPSVRPNLKALQGPLYKTLSHAEIKSTNNNAAILYDVSDPEGDDNGNGSYIYPTSVNLRAGSLDITHFTVSADDRMVYFTMKFRNLSNPGWHPEYGFQLTFAAVAIHTGDTVRLVQRQVGRNANYILDSSVAFEKIIYVGGGVSIEDASGKIIAEYRPAAGDEKNPLGQIATHAISFAVPVDILGKPSPVWRYSILVGAQDDHGGAGVGEFRTVGNEAGEWIGGGKAKPSDPNIYDVLLPNGGH
jgi:glycogen debranching enzyme